MKPQEFSDKMRGPYCHLNTSYKPDNVWEVDHEAMRSNLKHMIDHGCYVIDATGSAGEWGYLTDEERKECWKDLVAVGKGKCLCIAGNGHSSTKKCIEETKAAEKIGVDGFMTVGPMYHTPDEEGVYQHFKKIAEATSLGILVYNSSVLTHKVNINPTVMARLAQIPNIIGIKESCYDMDQWMASIRSMEKFKKIVVSGMGETFFLNGALISDVVVGCTSATATWDPDGCVDLYKAVQKRDWKAIADNFRRSDLFRTYSDAMRKAHPNTNPMKAVMDFCEGVRGGMVRPPLEQLKMTDAEIATTKDVLTRMGIKVKK